MANIVFIFYDVMKFIDSSDKYNDFVQMVKNLSLVDYQVFSLVNHDQVDLEKIMNVKRKIQDNTSFQIFFEDNFKMSDYAILNDYINSLKNIYNITGVYFIDSLTNLDTLKSILYRHSYELSAVYGNTEFKLTKKQYI